MLNRAKDAEGCAPARRHAQLAAGQARSGLSSVDRARLLGGVEGLRWSQPNGDQKVAEFTGAALLNRDYESRLFRHYRCPGYWDEIEVERVRPR
jgi:hypothetical protein